MNCSGARIAASDYHDLFLRAPLVSQLDGEVERDGWLHTEGSFL